MTKRKSDGEKMAKKIFSENIIYNSKGEYGTWFDIEGYLHSVAIIKAIENGLRFFINHRNMIFVYDERQPVE